MRDVEDGVEDPRRKVRRASVGGRLFNPSQTVQQTRDDARSPPAPTTNRSPLNQVLSLPSPSVDESDVRLPPVLTMAMITSTKTVTSVGFRRTPNGREPLKTDQNAHQRERAVGVECRVSRG